MTRAWQKRVDNGLPHHGLGRSNYFPGNVLHLVSPLVGHLRLLEQDGKTLDAHDILHYIDRLAFVLELAWEEDERLTNIELVKDG